MCCSAKKTHAIKLLWIVLLFVAIVGKGYPQQRLSIDRHEPLDSEPTAAVKNYRPEVLDTMTFEEVFRKIQSQTAGVLGDGYRQALPLPVMTGKTVSLYVIISPSVVKEPEGTIIFPPSYLGQFNCADGSLVNLNAVEPSYFKQVHPQQEPLGVANMPEGMTFEQFMTHRTELFAAYDILIPAFSRKEANLNEQQYKAAVSFLTLFPQLSEGVLSPYYEYVGQEYFSWLREKSRR
jgi:hypothetical protein